jgi:hypothetical protein
LVALAKAKSVTMRQLLKAVDQQASQAAVLAALTAWFGSRDAIEADQLPPRLISMLMQLGITRNAAERVGSMATVKSLSGRTKGGSPVLASTVVRRVAAEEPRMRAMYVLAAARRLTAAEDFDSAMDRETLYLKMHVQAGQNRRRAAKKVDDLGDNVLVWRTAGDSKVEARCAVLEGRLFTADNPPDGEIPGAVHPHCRCHAVVFGKGPLLNFGVI